MTDIRTYQNEYTSEYPKSSSKSKKNNSDKVYDTFDDIYNNFNQVCYSCKSNVKITVICNNCKKRICDSCIINLHKKWNKIINKGSDKLICKQCFVKTIIYLKII